MPLARMRERRKLIVWITAILIIPIFAFTFGTGLGRQDGARDYPALRIDGETVYISEVRAFLRRLSLVQGMRLPLDRTGIQLAGTLLLRLRVAREAGIRVSEAEVGTAIRQRLPQFFEDGSIDRQGYQKYVRERLQMTPEQFYLGIEEAIRLQKFRHYLIQTALVSPFEAYLTWARSESKVAYDRASVQTAEYRDRARDAIGDMDAAIADYLVRHGQERFVLGPPHWRLAYIVAPYEAFADLPVEPDEKDLREYYRENRRNFGEKAFEEVRDRVREAVIRRLRRAQAEATLALVDRATERLVGEVEAGTPIGAELLFGHEDSVALRKQRERGTLRPGTTGEEGLTPDGILSHDVIGHEPELVQLLEEIDALEDEERRRDRLQALTEAFSSGQHEFTNEVGAFKVRVLAYTPGEPRNPETNEAFRAELENRIIEEKAAELARAELEAWRRLVLEGKEEEVPFDEDGLTTEPLSFGGFYASELADPRLAPGDPTEIRTTAGGYEFKVLRSREVPDYAAFSALPAEQRNRYRDMLRSQQRYFGDRRQLWERLARSRVQLLLPTAEESAEG